MTISFQSLFSVAPAEESYLATSETPEWEIQRREEQQDIVALLETLSERHRDVLASRFGIGTREETGVETAKRLGLCKQRISQLLGAAKRELRSKYEEKKRNQTET